MKRLLPLISIFILLAVLASACGSAVPTAATVTLTDGLGRTVDLSAPAQRIVSLAPSNTEILFAIGAGAQVVGRDDFSDFPEDAKKLPAVGGSMGNYNFETIASLKPDLVLAAEINTPEQVKALEDLGIKVYYLSNPKSLDDLYANLRTVGSLSGHDKEANELADQLAARVKKVQETLANNTVKPTVFYELDGSEPAKPWTTGAGTFLSQLMVMAGGVNVGDKMEGQYGQMSLEVILAENPDVILLGDAAYGTTAEQVKTRAGWEGLKAVKDNQILTFDDNLVSRPGPRLVDGLETLAKLLHPDLFK